MSTNFLAFQQKQNALQQRGLTSFLTGSVNAPSGGPVSWKAMALTFLTVAFVILILLVIVHYTVRPIFKTTAAGGGYIPVPSLTKDKAGIYWTKTAVPLNSGETVLGDGELGTVNFSMAVDMLIQNPAVSSASERPIFWRSNKQVPDVVSNANGPSIVEMLGPFNFAMYLANETNDLIVSVLNAKHHIESVVLANAPVGRPFRMGMILSDRFLEIYVNGKLYKTRNLEAAPLAIAGSFVPPAGSFSDMAVLRNLRLWKGTITPAEMLYLPALPTVKEMNGAERPADYSNDFMSQVCGTGVSTSISSSASAVAAAVAAAAGSDSEVTMEYTAAAPVQSIPGSGSGSAVDAPVQSIPGSGSGSS